MGEITGFDFESRDADWWATLNKVWGFKEGDERLENILKFWPAYIRRRDMPRFLAHYELFKKILDIPGSIVECGVFRGSSLFTWNNFLETFCTADRYRKVYGFDHFDGLKEEQFGQYDSEATNDNQRGNLKSSKLDIEEMLRIHNDDNICPGFKRCNLVIGDVFDTVPNFLSEHPSLRISLLHLDMDIYKPTKFVLDQFWPYIVTGGIVVFDEYGVEPWDGETKAADEFFGDESHNHRLIQKMPFHHQPGGYIVK
ncbi:MAG: class I SAM-dependent methyltransferase [Lachnospiraceae bacterium]|nr:class I SAM-dependent methyltransferase [Lachnospiraceae bacterium]